MYNSEGENIYTTLQFIYILYTHMPTFYSRVSFFSLPGTFTLTARDNHSQNSLFFDFSKKHENSTTSAQPDFYLRQHN